MLYISPFPLLRLCIIVGQPPVMNVLFSYSPHLTQSPLLLGNWLILTECIHTISAYLVCIVTTSHFTPNAQLLLAGVGNLPLKGVYLVSCDPSQQLLQQVGALEWRNRWFGSRCVTEPANQDAQDKKPHTRQEVSILKQNTILSQINQELMLYYFFFIWTSKICISIDSVCFVCSNMLDKYGIWILILSCQGQEGAAT